MRYPSAILLAATLAACNAPAPSAPEAVAPTASTRPASLQALLDAELPKIPARSGIWVKHLKTGDEAGVRADEVFNSASVIKIPVAVLALQMADKGQLRLDQRITLTKEDVRGGSGIFRYHDPGLQPTVRDVLLQMIITSDNTATDVAIARVGGVERVNAFIKEAGYAEGMRLVQTTGELFRKYAALGEADDRNDKTNADHAYWLGEMTPRATGRLLEAIESRAIVSPAGGDELVRMMRAQLSGARRLPHYVSFPIGHKTGDFPPVVANDVGMAYHASGPIVVSFFLNGITGNYGEAEDAMGRVMQKIAEYYDR